LRCGPSQASVLIPDFLIVLFLFCQVCLLLSLCLRPVIFKVRGIKKYRSIEPGEGEVMDEWKERHYSAYIL